MEASKQAQRGLQPFRISVLVSYFRTIRRISSEDSVASQTSFDVSHYKPGRLQ